MIRVNKPADPFTAYMRRKATAQSKSDCEAFDINPAGYSTPGPLRLKLAIEKTIYEASGRTKSALIDASGIINGNTITKIGKCYYCESRLPEAGLQIEHFRPKNGFKKKRGGAEEYPGYFWLAYSWDNLILGCYECNRIKGTIFPLGDDTQRILSHIDKGVLDREIPLLINPGAPGIEPRDEITFVDDFPVSKTAAGKATIELLKLDYGPENNERPFLREQRLEFKAWLQSQVDILDDPGKDDTAKSLARKYLEKAKSPDSQFSSMAQDFLARLGPDVVAE